MTYMQWFETHAKKHEAIMKTLTHLSDDEVITYFIFENMQKKHPDFCPLYVQDKKCHEMEELNCYLCACNHFRFSDEGLKTEGEKTIFSVCSIDSKERKNFETEDAVHLDCSDCLLPHKRSAIKKTFSRDWREIMRETIVSS